MQTFDITVPPGGSFTINAPGDYVYFLDGSAGGADNQITVQSGSGGNSFLLRPGQAVKLDRTLDRWIIGNKAGAATIVGTLLIWQGEFSDNRISGSVEVIDGGKARTLSDAAFAGAFGTDLPPAGAYAQLGLFNLAGSGKNVVVESVALSASTAVSVNITRVNALLATLASGGQSKNYKALTPSVVAKAYRASSVTTTQYVAQGNTDGLWQLSVQANGKDLWIPREPIVIAPGNGLVMWANAPAVGFAGSFEWFEEKI